MLPRERTKIVEETFQVVDDSFANALDQVEHFHLDVETNREQIYFC
jgi:hypothetical protein